MISVQFDILCIHLEGGSPAIGVLLEIEAYINGFAVLQMDGFVTLSESDTVHSNHLVREVQMEMTSVTHGTRIPVVD